MMRWWAKSECNMSKTGSCNLVSRPRTEVFIACSMDGFIARPDGALDWLAQAQASAPSGEDFGYAAFMAGVDAIVMGRKTFETVLGFDPWPYAGKRVHVMTRQRALLVPAALREHVRLRHESPSALLSGLAGDGVGSVYLDGGELIQAFIAENLVDRLTITTVPVLIGRGRRLFGPLPEDKQWTLETVHHRSDCGFVQTCWKRCATPPVDPGSSGAAAT
jgi:dihydrofolate reductase